MHILLMYSPHQPSSPHLERLKNMDSDIRLTVADSEEEAIAAADTADVIFGHRYLRQSLPHADQLRWVQSTTNGVDRLPCTALAERDVTLTKFTGSADGVARHALALAFALTRGLPEAYQNQMQQHWDKDLPFLPAPERALVFGAGNVGRAIANFAHGLGLEVAGVKRTVDGSPSDEDFDELYDQHSWHSALENTDWCFLALPHTDETAGMIDEHALRELPPHAVLINVGRGETLDLNGLVAALEDDALGGAALDVLPASLEPLPDDHPLWSTSRLLVTPHVAAYDPRRRAMVEEFVEAQLQRFLMHSPLKDVVIPS